MIFRDFVQFFITTNVQKGCERQLFIMKKFYDLNMLMKAMITFEYAKQPF